MSISCALSDSIIFKWHENAWALTALPRALLFSILAQRRQMTSCAQCDVTWRLSYDMTKVNFPQVNHASENPKFMFFNLATLTFDLWPWPSKSSEILSRSTLHQILGLYVKRFSRKSAELQTDTHAHIDGTDFIPSTADVGGKNLSSCLSALY